MKKLLTITLIALFISSCVSKRETMAAHGLDNLNRDSYIINESATASVNSNRFWFLFIPIGGKSYEARKNKVIQRFLKQNKADGIIAAEIVDKKIIIPLIVVTYSFRRMTLTGKPCVIKTDNVTTPH
jgi:hypothetical protein